MSLQNSRKALTALRHDTQTRRDMRSPGIFNTLFTYYELYNLTSNLHSCMCSTNIDRYRRPGQTRSSRLVSYSQLFPERQSHLAERDLPDYFPVATAHAIQSFSYCQTESGVSSSFHSFSFFLICYFSAVTRYFLENPSNCLLLS